MIVCKVPFKGVPDGEVKPRQFVAGEVLTGDLAAVAVREGWAEDAKKKGFANRAKKGPGNIK